MKTGLNKIIFLTFLLIIFSSNISASVINCGDGKSVTLKETSKASPSGMTAYMPICAQMEHAKDENGNLMYRKITSGPGFDQVNSKDPEEVANYSEVWTKAYQADIDNKSVIPVDVQICNDKNARLAASMECSYVTTSPVKKDYCPEWETITETYVDQKCLKDCKNRPIIFEQNGLIENPNVEQMKKTLPGTCDCTKTREVTRCAVEVEKYHCDTGRYGYWHPYGNTCGERHQWTYETQIKFGDKGITAAQARVACSAENHHTCICMPSTTKYLVDCPVYRCKKGDILVDICTPDFEESNGNDVYCVNPSQPFSAEFEETSEYVKDESFNVKDCETSYSTVDCGYSNILIEGKYHNIDKKTIELALRLWGVHTNQSGFDKVGVSNRRGASCATSVFYMREKGYEGAVVNPYKRTYDEFRKVILDKVRDRDYIDPTEDLSVFELTCDISKLGVACGGNTTYKQAFALLANTILGNDKMQQHLRELFNGEISEDIKSVNLINEKDEEQYIEVHFTEIKEITSETNVEINCKKLDQMVRENKITAEQKAQIEPYCKVEVSIVDGNGNVLGKYGGGTPEYCYKDYCRVRTKKFAICDVEKEVRTPIKVRVTYNKSNSSMSINKYVSCSNPVNNQIMMGFDDELLSNSNRNDPNSSTSVERTSEEFVITNYKCAGTCDDYSLRGQVKDRCSDDTNNFNKTYNSSIKDPSLKCILNMGSPSYKSMYDYTDYFGVNPNVCRIYCSDEVEYYVADKVKSKSGQIFYYDIEQSVTKDKNIKYLFSNIIKEKRTCVSEIYYKNEFKESINWKKLYNLGSDKNYDGSPDDGITQSDIDGIKNWSTLFSVMVKKALNENGRTENLNKLLYDLYNCNLYSESEIEENGIRKPKNDDIGNIRENIIDKFSKENNYGIGTDSGCSITDTSNNCITMKNITNEFGADPSGKSLKMKSVTSNSNSFDKLVYCSGANCFAYSEETKDKEYEYPTSTTSQTTEIEIKSNTGEGLDFNGKTKIKVPTNDYVLFEASTQVSFYNSSLFEVKPSGDVITAGSNTTSDKYMKLQSFAFPINSDAYNLPACTSRSFLKDSNRCTITQQYDNVKTYYRRNINDDFSNKVKLSNKFTCFVDVTKPTFIPPDDGSADGGRNATIFKNVDVSNIFPSSSDGFTTYPKSNWGTDNGKKVTVEITNSSKDLITTDDYLDYRITLSPTQINNIKEYNQDNDSYINEEKTKCQIVDGTYQNCISPFMDELRRSNEYGTIDPRYSNGKSVGKANQIIKEKYYLNKK